MSDHEAVRLFVAVWPPDDVADSLAALAQPTEAGVRWVPRENLHATLRFLGQAAPDEVAARLSAFEFPRTAAVIGPVISRIGHDLVVVPVTGLDLLAERVHAATAGIGRSEPRRFRGHITLARLRNRAACSITGTRFAASFEVRAVTLVRSRTLPTGAVYETLRTFSARGR